MDRFKAQSLLRLMFDDGAIRCHLEREMGYEEFHKVLDEFRAGDLRNIGFVTDYIKKVCTELEG